MRLITPHSLLFLFVLSVTLRVFIEAPYSLLFLFVLSVTLRVIIEAVWLKKNVKYELSFEFLGMSFDCHFLVAHS